MDNYDRELEVLGRFYGKPVYGNPNIIKSLDYLNLVKDWKFLQFREEIEVEVPSLHECRIKLPNGIRFYLVKRRRTCFDYDWILLYADKKS